MSTYVRNVEKEANKHLCVKIVDFIVKYVFTGFVSNTIHMRLMMVLVMIFALDVAKVVIYAMWKYSLMTTITL